MSLVELNLDANTYSDEQLRQKFRLPANYTSNDIDVATRRLLETAKTSLGSKELEIFRQFITDASQRLLRDRAPEYADDIVSLLPTDRQLTTLPTPIIGNPTSASMAPPLPSAQPQPPLQEPMPTSVPWRDMKNRTQRVLCIDSQYRQNISTIQSDGSAGIDGAPSVGSNAFNTDFTLDLAEPLPNVMQIKLHAYYLPTTWYNFDRSLGNTAVSLDGGDTAFTIDDGNYTIDDLCEELQEKIRESDSTSNVEVTRDLKTNKVTISGEEVTFYKQGGMYSADGTMLGGNVINENLGWALGFRKSPDDHGIVTIDGSDTSNPAISDVPACVTGSKYFVLSIDDYSQNQQNKGTILASDDHGHVNTTRPPRMPQTQTQTTKAQLESQNALLIRNTTPYSRTTPPQAPNAFATIFLPNINELRPNPLTELNTSLQVFSRTYNGPTNIERIRVRLFDDKGNLVNLQDNDWHFSLLVEQLY